MWIPCEMVSWGIVNNILLAIAMDELLLQNQSGYLLVEIKAFTCAEWMCKAHVISHGRVGQIRRFLESVS
jgi:hypothetical protein